MLQVLPYNAKGCSLGAWAALGSTLQSLHYRHGAVISRLWFLSKQGFAFSTLQICKKFELSQGSFNKRNSFHKNEVDAGTFLDNFWIVVQLEIRDYLADLTFAVFQSVPGAMVSLNNTSVASHVSIELWLGIDVLLKSIFVGTNELIFKTQKSQQHARQIVWARLKIFDCALDLVI